MKKFLFLGFSLIFILAFCSPTNTSIVDTLTPPVILIINNDSVVMVEGANGKRCIINTSDKVNYRISFLKIGDTLKIE